jgi:hypothetical protein
VGGTLNPPDVMGGRMYMRPFPGSRVALGASAIVDLNPARDFVTPGNNMPNPDAAGNPIFITPGVDLDVPFVESDFLGLVFFTDGAVLIPYFRTVPTAFPSVSAGFATKAFLDPSARMAIKNWGTAAGFLGNLLIPDFTYKVQYELYTGAFKPQIYDSGYDRNRGAYVLDTLNYLATSSTLGAYNMGIYGEAGFKLTRIFSLNVGYFWPWTMSSGGGITADPHQDHFVATFALERGVIPVVNIWGSVSYERTGLASAGFTNALFDANTVVSAQINYPVSPIMDVSLIYTTTAARDLNGNLQFDPGSILPKMSTSLSIQTEVHL